MPILATIIPIFVIIALGSIARRRGFIPSAFLEPANRLVYYLAIPAMIFGALSRSSLRAHFDLGVVVLTLLSALAAAPLALAAVRRLPLRRSQRGTFIQNSIHGNTGYIGLAVAYYYLGDDGFVSAGIIAGFLIMLQNLLAVTALQTHSEGERRSGGRWAVAGKIFGNPILVSALLGIAYSLSGFPLPRVAERSLSILSGLALPTALLVIGASLSFRLMRENLGTVLAMTGFKLVLLPGLGLTAYLLAGVAREEFLPGIILLASPTAAVSQVMAQEMGGDADLAVAGISASTLLSAVSFSVWLGLLGT